MLIKYLADEAKEDKLLENPQLFKTPIVRNSRQGLSATNRRYGKHGNKASSDAFQ